MSLLKPLSRDQLANTLMERYLSLHVALTNPASTNEQTLEASREMRELITAIDDRCI